MQQIKVKGIIFSKGVVQDATFITANPGMTQSEMENRGRGKPTTRNEDEIIYRDKGYQFVSTPKTCTSVSSKK